MGGYDIFRSLKDGGTSVVRLTSILPLTPPDDDIFYVSDSLNQTAYFASARNSALGDLHVYKVRVEGIPLNFILLQGDYISYLDESNPEATLVIKEAIQVNPLVNRSSLAST